MTPRRAAGAAWLATGALALVACRPAAAPPEDGPAGATPATAPNPEAVSVDPQPAPLPLPERQGRPVVRDGAPEGGGVQTPPPEVWIQERKNSGG